MKRLFAFVAFLPLWAACPPPAQVGAQVNPVPRNSAATCAGYCQSIGLPLDAVVIMANNVGCVCGAQQRAAPGAAAAPTTSVRSAGAAGGMTGIMIAEQQAADQQRRNDEAARQRQQQQQQQQQH